MDSHDHLAKILGRIGLLNELQTMDDLQTHIPRIPICMESTCRKRHDKKGIRRAGFRETHELEDHQNFCKYCGYAVRWVKAPLQPED